MSQTETYKIQLKNELTKVISDLETIAAQNPETGDWVAIPNPDDLANADENVMADSVEEWNERRGLMSQLEVRYRNIVRALEKIKSDTYGICEISGQPIEDERLAVNPAARTNLANLDREKELPI
ncbi:MAG: RNA polymerase-binding transcription factor DksA [Candidatus Paceibacteria bacterium]|jgi:RNA polymerase-binding transcription factor DksA